MDSYFKSKRLTKILFVLSMLGLIGAAYSQNDPSYLQRSSADDLNVPAESAIDKRRDNENKVLHNHFAITFYKQNYILPFYYTRSPYYNAYQNYTPDNEKLKRSEMKFQLSFKVPVWDRIFDTRNSLYFAYTQLSYWQLYNKKAFFRSTDYEPEIFLQHEIDWALGKNWRLDILKIGAIHQSNGFGTSLERSWNRMYLEMNASNTNMLIGVKPWVVFHDNTYKNFNPDMSKYLGYGELLLAYKYDKQVISLQSHGLLEQGGRYASANLTYSFPIYLAINGFVEVFSGYGQSLIEYNHRSNSVGVGVALSNYI